MKDKKQLSRYKVNSDIRAKQVRLVGDNVVNGIYSYQDAIKISDDLNLDLLEINGNNPELPICKVVDFQKFLYEKKKADKVKQPKVEVKELRLRPATDENDLLFKIKHARAWLVKGDFVKVSVFFKGREMTHKEFGYQIIERIKTDLADVGSSDNSPIFEGPRLILMLKPNGKKG
jgi:translation initiation factor IF-3